MPGRSITVTIPLPPEKLHPNKMTTNRFEKRTLTKRARFEAGVCCKAALLEAYPGRKEFGEPMIKATFQATFFFAKKNRRDDDNLNGWLKAARDSTADAGIIKNDHGYRMLEPKVEIDPKQRVEITITELPQ